MLVSQTTAKPQPNHSQTTTNVSDFASVLTPTSAVALVAFQSIMPGNYLKSLPASLFNIPTITAMYVHQRVLRDYLLCRSVSDIGEITGIQRTGQMQIGWNDCQVGWKLPAIGHAVCWHTGKCDLVVVVECQHSITTYLCDVMPQKPRGQSIDRNHTRYHLTNQYRFVVCTATTRTISHRMFQLNAVHEPNVADGSGSTN
jgi:hypothetical protein